MPTGLDFSQALAAANATPSSTIVQPSGTDNSSSAASSANDVKPATSWRVDRSAANVDSGDEEFGFTDFLDILNPLQHIPIIGTVYRELTGDQIKPVSRVAGDLLYGALTGNILVSGVLSVASAAVEQQTGGEPLVQVADALFGTSSDESADDKGNVAVAATVPESTPLTAGVTPVQVAAVAAASSSSVAGTTTAPALTPAPTSAPSSVNATQAAGAASTKQPFGGVMDMAAANRNQQIMASQIVTTGNTPVTRIGNTIYTSPALNNAARMAALRANAMPPVAKTPDTQASNTTVTNTASTATPETSPSVPQMSLPSSAPTDGQALGQLMHEQAQASREGNALPPDLVRDMMTMALDKYKTASGLGSGAMSTSAAN